MTDRPQGATLYTVPMGTSLQAVGRTDDSKWLYVIRDAVIKGGEEVEPALAGWTAKVDVIAFSIENLPVLDAEDDSEYSAGPGPNDGRRQKLRRCRIAGHASKLMTKQALTQIR